jgi:PAS domain S-box-containing protein
MHMRLFRNASIQRKQTLIIMLTTAVALLLACAAFTTYEVITFRKAMLRNLATLGEIVGDNSAAALDFNDPKAAVETLAALKEEPNIVGACIYLKNGTLFAVYDRSGDGRTFVPPKFQMNGHSFGRSDLILFDPIDYKGDTIGVVCLASDMRGLYSRLAQYAVIVAAVFLVAMFVALLISARLQRLISKPILNLVQTAQAVAQDKNYSLRAVKANQDELGVLVDGFNAMLAQIQERDAALQKTHDELEHRVGERTQELANSLSLLHATLESNADGILVVNAAGQFTSFNEKFLAMWQISRKPMISEDVSLSLKMASDQLKDPEAFLAGVRHLSENPDAESFDVLQFKDGRVWERYSTPQRIGERSVGRVWNFRDVTERKRAETELENAHRQLIDTSRQAGMAEVATSVLHNVGNVLNSVNISSSLVSDKIRKSRVSNLAKAVALMQAHKDDLAAFLGEDAKGRQLPDYLANLSVHLADEQEEILQELSLLNGNIEHIKEIVAMQQSYARVSGVLETLNLADLMEDALRMNAGALDRHQVRVIREFDPALSVTVEKHKVLQILVNLIRNAKYALDDGMPAEKQMTLRFAASGNDQVSISVIDNGIGIPAGNLTRIFGHGFTTRKAGHGFGLHSGALAARELGGSLTVQSDGPGKGACFTLEFPREPHKK